MPKISTYTAGKLASEQVGVPSTDQSGAIIGDAVTRVAGGIVNEIDAALTKQRNLLQRAEVTKKISQFDSDMAVTSAKIKQENLSSPDAGVKQLEARRKEIFEGYKVGITDPDVKLQFDALGSESLVKGQALDKIWAFQENNRLIQKDHFDRISNDVAFAGQTDNFNEVIEKAYLLDKDREDFYQAWGGVIEGGQVIDKGQEGLLKSYFYGQLSKGNAFKVLKEIESGQFGPTDDTNGLIDPQKLKAMKTAATTMAKAGKDDAAANALIGAVQTNYDIDAALNEPISATEEKINSLSFEIEKKKELEKIGEVSAEEIAVLEQHQELLENIRGTQMSRSNMFVVPDEQVQADMTARFFGLFGKKGLKAPFKATLEEVFKFQQDLVKNRDSLDPAFVKKYSALTQAAFQSEIQGFKKGSKLATKKSWFGLGPTVAEDKGQLTGSKKLQNIFSDMIGQHNPEDGNQQLFETMQIFVDDLDERLDLRNEDDLQMLPQVDIDQLMTSAKRKMQLKKMGLPIYLGEKNVIYNNGVGYTIVGFDTDGMAQVEPR